MSRRQRYLTPCATSSMPTSDASETAAAGPGNGTSSSSLAATVAGSGTRVLAPERPPQRLRCVAEFGDRRGNVRRSYEEGCECGRVIRWFEWRTTRARSSPRLSRRFYFCHVCAYEALRPDETERVSH